MSFETLIDRKNIPHKEKLYYLRQYLGGTAKTSFEGFFLLGTEAAYESAWQLLEKRFGDPSIIGKAFRNKLHDWPKNNSKVARELRDFADLLRSCEAAMPYIKTLEVLNDCNANCKPKDSAEVARLVGIQVEPQSNGRKTSILPPLRSTHH